MFSNEVELVLDLVANVDNDIQEFFWQRSAAALIFRIEKYSKDQTRRLVNVRSHMMFRPELIYIFD